MYSSAYQRKIVLLSTGFQYPDRHLLFSRARLFLDHIELSGWEFGTRHHVAIPLEHIRYVEWRSLAVNEPNVVLYLEGETTLTLILQKAHLWRHTLEARLRWMSSGSHFEPFCNPHDLSLQELVAYATSMS